MLRHILNIMWNERGSNVALWVELVLASLLLWFFTDKLTTYYRVYQMPMGCDIEHVYKLNFDMLTPNSPEWQDLGPDSVHMYEDFQRIVDRLEHCPMLEATSLSRNSFPHQGSNSTYSVYRDTMHSNMLVRQVTKGFFDVFKIEWYGADTPDLRADFSGRTVILSEASAKQLGYSPIESARGDKLRLESDSDSPTFSVLGVYKDMRMHHFSTSRKAIFLPFPVEEALRQLPTPAYLEVGIRVKPEEDHDFMHRFRAEMGDQLHVGNIFLDNIERWTEQRDLFHKGFMNELHRITLLALFVAACVVLGVIGAFWYRTQLRREQIGIRMALGDRPRRLLWMYLAEGELLLAFTVPFPVVGYYLCGHFGLLDYAHLELSWRPLLGISITYAILGLFILLGVWLPARKAVQVPPCEAIRNE